MRLHLPKTLLAAVLAACASLDAYAGVSGSAFEINSTETNDSESMSGYATFADGKYSSVNTDPTDKTAVTTIRPGDSTTGTIAELNVASDKALSISANGTSNFTDLTISRINVAGTGSAALNIAGAQVVKIGGASGTVNFSVSGTDAGELIFNGSGAYGNYSTSGKNFTRKIKVTNSSIVTFDTINNSWGMGAIDVAAASELKATSIILKSGDNSGGDLQGGKITGDGSANVTTLTVGNVGNYTINVANFEAGTLDADWVDASKQLTLSSSTLRIGTLNQTNGTIKITSATSAAITSLNISGGIIDASEMTGTLTISGATWTGNLTDASVEVLKAKDAATATSLANSMNTTHRLNYSFSVTESSVYRVRRTESLTGLTAKLQGNPGSRIVVDATYDGTTFTNVGLNELLAGDKVTIDGLTGWIGDNTSNSILADLEFTGQNHINNGSSSNSWITYSGAITGNGTLSYEWGTAAYTYNFNGNLSGFTGTISDTTTLNVTIGGTPAMDAAKAVNATIDIAGALTVNREASFAGSISVGGALIIDADATFSNTVQAGGNITVTSGVFRVEKSASTNAQLDLSNGDTSTGCVEIASGASLTVGTNIWGTSNDTFASKILLEKDADLVWNGFTITGKTAKDGVETGLRFGGSNVTLASNNSAHSVTNSVITSTGTKTLSWTLDGCGVSVSTGTLTVNGTNTDTALNVSGGSALFDNSTSTSLVDSTVSGGIVKLEGHYTTLKGTLNISGGTVTNTASGTTQGEVEAPLKLGQNGKVVISGGSLENDGFTYTKTDTESTAGTNDASLALTNNATSGSLKVFAGDLKITNATMTKTATTDKGIGIALENVTLVLGEGTKTTTLQNDGKTSKTQNLSGVSVASGATLKVENTNATLGVVSGTGTVSTSVDNEFSLARTADGTGSTFSGTLEATAGTLTVTGVGKQEDGTYLPHVMTALKASGGTLNVMETPFVSITEMVIGADSTVGVYTGSAQGEAQEGSVYMHGTNGDNAKKGSLTIASGAKLNADLQLINTTLTFNGTLTMGSDLTLSSGNELAGSLYDSWDKKSDLTLFTGVDNLYIGSDEAVADKEYEASSVFSNIGDGYSLKMLSGTAGNYSVMLVQSSNPTPEPTTATLSLLALMGLAARRRRKA